MLQGKFLLVSSLSAVLFGLTMPAHATADSSCHSGFVADPFGSRPELRPLRIEPGLAQNPPLRTSEWVSVPKVDLKIPISTQDLSVKIEVIAFNSLRPAQTLDEIRSILAAQETEAGKASQAPSNDEIMRTVSQLVLQAVRGTPEGMHVGRPQLGFLIVEKPRFFNHRTRGVIVNPGSDRIIIYPDLFDPSVVPPKERDLAIRNAIYQLRLQQGAMIGKTEAVASVAVDRLVRRWIQLTLENGTQIPRPWLAQPDENLYITQRLRANEAGMIDALEQMARLVQLELESEQAALANPAGRDRRRLFQLSPWQKTPILKELRELVLQAPPAERIRRHLERTRSN